jgi:hypothetical protein
MTEKKTKDGKYTEGEKVKFRDKLYQLDEVCDDGFVWLRPLNDKGAPIFEGAHGRQGCVRTNDKLG